MKLVRFGSTGTERPGIIDGAGELRDLSSIVGNIDASVLTPRGLDRLRAVDLNDLPRVRHPERLGACVTRPGKFICIGLNYADHAKETGAPLPEEPVLFMKATTAVCGPYDNIVKPRGSTKLDWEVELAVVIGSQCRYAAEDTARSSIAGYCICNDVSERAFQMERGGQWDKGKGCDSFGPLGPWLVTADDIPDTGDLAMWLDVNGKRFQSSSTRMMIFKPEFLVAYVSQFMSLEPGDVISTGTPAGVGLAQKPPLYLYPGDVVTLGIAGLGEQRQVVVASD
jgi:2-keto-4-pentenoate hydratase/2-oxohepta-3-ene-1,7-dioic acid hydratase in catechol pathway